MPRYDYRCEQCDEVYEKVEGFDAPSLQECIHCGATARRVLTPPPIIFKGRGWYITDSRGASSAVNGASSTSKDEQGHGHSHGHDHGHGHEHASGGNDLTAASAAE